MDLRKVVWLDAEHSRFLIRYQKLPSYGFKYFAHEMVILAGLDVNGSLGFPWHQTVYLD